AEAEKGEDGRVLALQGELELRFELVEVVEVRHARVSLAPGAGQLRAPGRGPRAPERARPGARARTRARGAGDAALGDRTRRSLRSRTRADRGRRRAAPSAPRGSSPESARRRGAGRGALWPRATSPGRPRRSGTSAARSGRPARSRAAPRRREPRPPGHGRARLPLRAASRHVARDSLPGPRTP